MERKRYPCLENENHQLENEVYPASQKPRRILYFGEKAARNQLLPPKIFLNNYVHLSAYAYEVLCKPKTKNSLLR